MSERAEAAEWRPLKGVGLMGTIGPLLARRAGSGWRYALATGPQHANAVGIIHGGTLTALLDQAMSLIAWEAVERQPIVTVQMDTSFLSAAGPGEFLEADAVLRHRQGSMVFMDATVTSDGRQVARASAVMKVSANRPREDRHGD